MAADNGAILRGAAEATALRHTYRLGDGPCDVFALICEAGHGLVRTDCGDDGGGAVAFVHDGWSVIAVNTHFPDTAQRWAAAHALGHLRMHAPNGFQSMVKVVPTVTDEADQSTDGRAAQLFATTLLVPTSTHEDRMLYRHRDHGFTAWDICEMAAFFQVPYTVMVRTFMQTNPLAGMEELDRLNKGIDPMLTWRHGGPWQPPSQQERRLPSEPMARLAALSRAELVEDQTVAEILDCDPHRVDALKSLYDGMTDLLGPETDDSLEELALADLPALRSEWNVKANGPFDGDEPAASHRRVQWKCRRDDEHCWSSRISSRVRGAGCPFCGGQFWDADALRSLLARFDQALMAMPPSRVERYFDGHETLLGERTGPFVRAYIDRNASRDDVRAFINGDDSVLARYPLPQASEGGDK